MFFWDIILNKVNGSFINFLMDFVEVVDKMDLFIWL